MTPLSKRQTMGVDADNTLPQTLAVGNQPFSRRTFCRSALIGGSLLGLMLGASGRVMAQEDEIDPPELEDLVGIGADEDDESVDPDQPDLEDPSIDSFQLFLPVVQGGTGVQIASDESTLATPAVQQAKPISNREQALRAAISQIGYHEEPLRSNRTKYGRYFGVNYGAPWCVYFASWAFDWTGNRDGKVPWPAGPVQGILDWARKKEQQGRNVLFAKPRRGDILIMKGGRVSHVAIVRWVYDDNLIRTVEGNTSFSPARNSDERAVAWVASKRRNLSVLRGKGVPYYFLRVPKNPW